MAAICRPATASPPPINTACYAHKTARQAVPRPLAYLAHEQMGRLKAAEMLCCMPGGAEFTQPHGCCTGTPKHTMEVSP